MASVRQHTAALAAPLSPEDQCVQSMPDASPVKWHLAHSTWFFEALVLPQMWPDYRPFDSQFLYLFNSYYESLGTRHPRPQRGLLTRPSAQQIQEYRAHVDAALHRAIAECDDATWQQVRLLLLLGLQHEQQHQELILTDILHLLSCNPLQPAYERTPAAGLRLAASHRPMRWQAMPGGVVHIGHAPPPDAAEDSFAFDNELPRHPALLAPYEIADRLVTCGEYAQFIADGGYRRPQHWLSDGWAAVQAQGWAAPLYWRSPEDPRVASRQALPAADWYVFGLQGLRPMDPEAPVSQLSFYEAAAYADWAGARLPTEQEWEAAASAQVLQQATGLVWQWTRSSYDPYPGFRPLAGTAAEYNGKFMVGQLVLRGSSVATPPGHARPSYRNFFPPAARWQFSGLRLAKDAA
nr:ergothioneine biosynthesis protein EgtB [Xylophilus sp. ASV27]